MKIINPIRQAGFTLVELIIVIVILGILSAFAVPKFIDVTSDARLAAVEGIAGSMNSAASIVHAGFVAAGNDSATSVSMSDGSSVTVTNKYPAGTTAGILAAIGIVADGSGAYTTGDITCTASSGDVTCQINSTCKVVYSEATSSAAPTTTITSTGC